MNLSADGGMFIIEDRLKSTVREIPSFTCCHCNRVVAMHPERRRARNVCRRCMARTCDAAPCVLECDPVDKKLEQSRPLLLPHQVPDELAELWFPESVRSRTPQEWLPRRLR